MFGTIEEPFALKKCFHELPFQQLFSIQIINLQARKIID
jgi:hypothetical protein